MLTAYADVIHYLLNRRWISNEMVVQGDLAVVDASRRNGNFKVLNGAGPHYFLKQETRLRAEHEPKLASVAYEAVIYELLEGIHGDKAVFRCLPHFYAFDREEGVLILEALVGWMNLGDHYLRRGYCSSSIAGRLGAVLAGLHRVSEEEKTRIERCIGVSAIPPWVFFLPEPDEWVYLNSSLSNIELLGILQQSDELCRSFEDLRRQWRNATLIHSDLKWDNCLVPFTVAPQPKPALKIVDWELARLGDPCWDVGTVFSGYLDAWLSSIPISGEDPPDRFLRFARFPLEKMQPALRTFWRMYRRRMEIPAADVAHWLERATSFAGVRLVQTAFEQQQIEAGVTTKAVFLLQLCSNIVTRPLEAAVQLLGLPLSEPLHEYPQLC